VALLPSQNSLLITDYFFFPIPGLTRNPAGGVVSLLSPFPHPRHCEKRSDEAIWLASLHLHSNENLAPFFAFFSPLSKLETKN
jgi:hypothetical protein